MIYFLEGFLEAKTKMDYKSKKEKGTVMNKKFKIHEAMKEHVHYKIKRHGPNSTIHVPGTKKGIDSSMFMVTVHPVGGLKDKEIDILIHFILNAVWIMYYGIGIEVITKADGTIWKHMHISFVTKMMTNVDGIKAFFHGLIDEKRMLSIPNRTKDTGTVENISLKIESCGSNFFDTKTPMAQCAYAMKGAGIGKTRDEITEEDYNNKTTRWCNLFDDEAECTDEVEQQQWRLNRITFAHELVEEIKKTKNNPPFLIHKKYHIEAAQKYAKENDMEWTDDIADGTHVHVLATMVTATAGDTRYELAPGFLNTAIQDDLNCKKKKEDYKTILEETLVAHFKGVKAKAARVLAKAAAGGVTTSTRDKNKRIIALKLRNQELATQQQELNKKILRLKEEMNSKEQRNVRTIVSLQNDCEKEKEKNRPLVSALAKSRKELSQAVMELMDEHPMKNNRGEWETLGPLSWGVAINDSIIKKCRKRQEEAVTEWRKRSHFELVGPDDAKPWAAPTAKRQKIGSKRSKGEITNVRVTAGHATVQKIEKWNDVKVIGSSLLPKDIKERRERLEAIAARNRV